MRASIPCPEGKPGCEVFHVADPTLPYPMTCRKCGTPAADPQYFVQPSGRPYLVWRCGAFGDCGYTWTEVIYRDPITEIEALKEEIKELKRQVRELELRKPASGAHEGAGSA